jgi:iron complex outermembrane receptor protein
MTRHSKFSRSPLSHSRVARLNRVALAAALSCAPWALALAQEATPSAPAAAPAAAGKLEVVTVTAERRTEKLKDVPIAVTTLSGEKLDVLNSSGEDVRVLSGRVPSLNIESSFGRAFPRFYIRGFGNTDFRLNASQPVSLVFDDVVLENPILKGFPVFDLQNIEVLAGPQGSLFGRNTPAGVVKFDSVKPSQKSDAYVSATVGSFGARTVEAAANLPLSGDWSARVSAQTQHRDGYVTNTVRPNEKLEGYDDSAIRLQALYAPSASFSALFNLHGRDINGTARLFRANIIQPGTNNLVSGFDINKVSIDGLNKQTLTSSGGSMRLKWVLDDVNVYAITGLETVRSVSRGDVDGGYGASYAPPYGPGFIPFSSETADGIRDHHQWTQEVRVESRTQGPLKWQAGGYYFKEGYYLDAYAYNSVAPGNPLTGVITTHQSNDAYALFGSVNYALSPVLTLRGGLRYTHDKKDLSTQNAAGVVTSNGLAASTDDGKVNFDVAATYVLTPDVNVYSRIATGFRGSSIQPASAFGALTQAGPETVTSYEVGTKADLFEHRARTSISAFHYDVANQQLTAVGGASNSTSLVSAKKSMGQGLELSLDGYITDDLLITLGGSYNLTRIKDSGLSVFGCAACTVTNPAGATAGTYLINGNPLPNAPKYIANFTARYGIPSSSGGEYFVYTDWVYRSKVNFFLYQSVEFTGKSLLEGGLRAGYNWNGGKYEAAVFARNITNQIRVTGAIDFNNLTGFVNEPRTVGVQFKAAL